MPDTIDSPAPRFSERDRESLIDAIHRHTQALDRLAGPINKVDIRDLGESIAGVERAALSFIERLRLFK